MGYMNIVSLYVKYHISEQLFGRDGSYQVQNVDRNDTYPVAITSSHGPQWVVTYFTRYQIRDKYQQFNSPNLLHV